MSGPNSSGGTTPTQTESREGEGGRGKGRVGTVTGINTRSSYNFTKGRVSKT